MDFNALLALFPSLESTSVLRLVGFGLVALAVVWALRARQRASTSLTSARALDGDSLEVTLSRGRSLQVRLHGIDCPEYDQAFGPEAHRALARAIKGKTLRLARRGAKDRYGRTVGQLWAGKTDVGLLLLEAGLAYVLSNAPARYRRAQATARRARLGVWSQGIAIRPWEHRRRGAWRWKWFGRRRRRA